MLKKLVLVLFVLVLAGAAVIYFRAQAIFSSDLVRTSVESQLTRALGQPVSIGSIGASLTPRLTMAAGNVRIGADDAIVVEQLDVGTSLGALLSRRIERATLVVDGARITLPLPPLPSAEATRRHQPQMPVAASRLCRSTRCDSRT